MIQKAKILVDNKVYNLNNNQIIFTSSRKKQLLWYQKLLAIDSPIIKVSSHILKIIFEFLLIGWIVVTITFFLINAVPGANGISAGISDPTQRMIIESQYGLNLPLVERYGMYLVNLVRGDFGISLSLFPTAEINSFIWNRFYKSFLVGIFAVGLTVGIGIPVGIFAGKNPGKLVDSISTVVVSLFSAVPSIILALLLVFAGRGLNLPYIFNEGNFLTYLLPGLALSLQSIIVYIKYIRTELNRELNSNHAKFAYLKGVSRNRFVWKHALKPSLFPIATFFPAVIFGSFLGSIFVEQIFLISGSGATLLQAIQTKDYNVILFLIILFALLTILSFAARDILYEIIDPRVRRKGK